MRWWKNKWQKVRKHTIWKGCCFFFLLWLSWWLMIYGPSNQISSQKGHSSKLEWLYMEVIIHCSPWRRTVYLSCDADKKKLGGSEVQEKREERLEERLKSSMESFDAWNQSHKADRWGASPGVIFCYWWKKPGFTTYFLSFRAFRAIVKDIPPGAMKRKKYIIYIHIFLEYYICV